MLLTTHTEQIITTPTRQNNILDIFITNRPSLASQCHTIPGLGDHYAISIHSSAQAHRTKPARRKIHLRRHADIDNLKQDARSFTSSFTQTFTIDSIHTTRCSMRETRETALLHAWVQSPIRPHSCISSLHAYSYIQQSGRSVKTMNAKNTKNHRFMRMQTQT